MSKTVVVGAGAVGLACAYALARRGLEVTVIDKGEPGAACSRGNAGWIVPSLSAPIPEPGLGLRSLGWILRRQSPLFIDPKAVVGMAGWLWSFWRHCNPADYHAGITALAELNRETMPLFDALEADGVEFEMHRRGLLYLCLEERQLQRELEALESLEEFGVARPEVLDAARLRELQPGLSEAVIGACHVAGERHVRPETLTAGLAERLVELGAELHPGVEVLGALRRGKRVNALESSRGRFSGDQFLIAAGAWSGLVARQLGVKLPIQAGKGYSITFDEPDWSARLPLSLGEAHIACTPFEGGMRFSGTMELSGINERLDRRRVAEIRRAVGRYLVHVPNGRREHEWVGMRPLTPDGLPLIGRLPPFENLFVAAGHAMLGITLAPATGERIAGLMTASGSPVRPDPFDPARFRS